MAIALYPGSFDPITYGHLDVIERAAHLFDKVWVAVLKNPHKVPLFTPEQRVRQIQQATAHLSTIEVSSFVGLTVTYARAQGAHVLIRGLRVLSDFEGELQMAHTNKLLAPELETLFLATASDYSFLSSSLVKEVARFGGDVSQLVPPHVATDLTQAFQPRDP
ncbi:MAG: pantetheine-phosphate adenylyltransferase [Synechococcales cyanobacterium]